jgi:PPOX class probable FMN-dependent enzyme
VLRAISQPAIVAQIVLNTLAPHRQPEPIMPIIKTIEELEALYGQPSENSLIKEVGQITPQYAALIEASPFVALATSGPEGLDCSPRGDLAGFVRVHDDKTLMMPDRRGNNRADSLRNIIRDPRIALLFLIPGSGTTLRINGRAHLTTDGDITESFAVGEKAPRSVIVVGVDSVYFQCARAIVRSDLWNSEKHVGPKSLPTPGQILANLTDDRIGGKAYDDAWTPRAAKTLW